MAEAPDLNPGQWVFESPVAHQSRLSDATWQTSLIQNERLLGSNPRAGTSPYHGNSTWLETRLLTGVVVGSMPTRGTSRWWLKAK